MPEIQQPWLVSFLPPSPTFERAAFAVSTFLLVAFAITIPFAQFLLPQLNIYIPLVATVMFLNDSITASLLLVQFSIARSRTLLLLANGYLFTALVAAVYGLVWAGAFHPTGLLGAGPQTPPWLYLVWPCRIAHIGHCVRAAREQRIRDAACSAGFGSHVHFREHHLQHPDRVWIDVVCYTVSPRSADLGNVCRSVKRIFSSRNGRYFDCFHRCACLAVEKPASVGARPVAVGRDTGMAIRFNHVERYRRPL